MIAAIKNCINCGAPLQGNRCEYCGTEYNGTTEVGFNATISSGKGSITIDGDTIEVYVGDMENTILYADERIVMKKRKITLIEL